MFSALLFLDVCAGGPSRRADDGAAHPAARGGVPVGDQRPAVGGAPEPRGPGGVGGAGADQGAGHAQVPGPSARRGRRGAPGTQPPVPRSLARRLARVPNRLEAGPQWTDLL